LTASVKFHKQDEKKYKKNLKNQLTICSLIVLPSKSIVLIFYKKNHQKTHNYVTNC